jgi:hypoxanthine-guanine phosphoribosyltransferase
MHMTNKQTNKQTKHIHITKIGKILRNAPAGYHQLVVEDLMETGTLNCIRNACSLRKKKKEEDYHQH